MALKGARASFGWIEYLRVENAPVVGNYTMTMGAHNLIVGRNGVGKTMLVDLLASGSNPEHLERLTWQDREVRVDLRWHDPDPRLLRVIADGVTTQFTLDGKPVPIVPIPYQVLKFDEWRTVREPGNARNYGMYERSFINTLKAAQELSGGSIHDARLEGDGTLRLATMRGEKVEWCDPSSSSLSAGESRRLYLDICLAVAAARAQERVTLLVFDGGVSDSFDPGSQRRLFARLNERQWPFQIVVTSTREDMTEVGADWLVTYLRREVKAGSYSVDQKR